MVRSSLLCLNNRDVSWQCSDKRSCIPKPQKWKQKKVKLKVVPGT